MISAAEHRWEISPIKYLVTVNDDVLPENTPADRPVSYVDISNVDADRGITGYEELVFGKAPSRARRLVRRGDVIVSTVRTYLRAIAQIEETRPELVVSTGFTVLRPQTTVESRFFGYAMQSRYLIDEIVARSTGVSYPAITATDLVGLKISYPIKEMQRAIADFLDRETAEADALIAKYERLLELLEEKRVAMITQAVTKGLDPNAPMKDSGVDWIGEIPAHWDVVSVRRLAAVRSGAAVHEGFLIDSASAAPFFKVGDIDSADADNVMREARSFVALGSGMAVTTKPFPEGTIVFAKRGAALLLNRFRQIDHEAFLDTNLMGLNVDERKIQTRFALRVLSTIDFARFVKPGALPSIDAPEIKNLIIAIAPLQEQSAIVSDVDRFSQIITDQVLQVQRAIELVKERRSAIITAAVTGQIDITAYKSDIAKEVA